MDSMGTLRLVELGDFALSHDHAAHAGAHNHADSPRILFPQLQARIRQCFFGRDECKLRIPVHPLRLNAVEIAFGRKPMDLSGDLRPVAVHGKRVEPGDCRHTGTAVQGGFPEFTHPDSDRADHSQSGDDDPTRHAWAPLATWVFTYRKRHAPSTA